MSIRPMSAGDLDQVVELHLVRFPDSRSTSLGRPFVRRMYQWFLVHEPDLALVSEIDQRVEGFVVGSRGGYGRRVFRYALPQVILGLCLHPRICLQKKTFLLSGSYLRAFLPGPKCQKATGVPGESSQRVAVASVAASRTHAGEGLYLIKAIEDRARSIGAKLMSASIELRNERLIALHLRLGWTISSRNTGGVSLRKALAMIV